MTESIEGVPKMLGLYSKDEIDEWRSKAVAIAAVKKKKKIFINHEIYRDSIHSDESDWCPHTGCFIGDDGGWDYE